MHRRRLAAACIAAFLLSAAPSSGQNFYAPRSDWTSFTGGDLNISGFVFRDVNGDGVYGRADRPMEGIATRMTSRQGAERLRWTNFNGFANFSMSARDPDSDISNPGLYDFQVMLPDGWRVTTGNALQTKHFQVTPGAISDMSANPPFFPVGIAPILTISGTVPPTAGKDQRISVRSPSGPWRQMARGDVREFRIPAHPGVWEVAVSNDNGSSSVSRSVTVRNVPVQLSAAGKGGGNEVPGSRVVIDFEDITERDIREMPSGVGGLRWWNMIAYVAGQPAYTNNVTSGNYVGYNSSGHPARIWSPKPFSFVGGYFGVAWRRSHGETLRLQGWRSGELVYEDTIRLSYLGPIWFQADYRDIDRLDLATEHYWQFVSDDLSFIVPEPEAIE